jgi:DnaK suppressor protein
MTQQNGESQGPGQDRLTVAQLQGLQRSLEAKRSELRRKAHDNLTAATVSDEHLIEPEDIARHETSSAEMLGLADRQRELVEEIDAALRRMELGTYGISESSGEPIPYNRLVAVPWARNAAHEEETHERARR